MKLRDRTLSDPLPANNESACDLSAGTLGNVIIENTINRTLGNVIVTKVSTGT